MPGAPGSRLRPDRMESETRTGRRKGPRGGHNGAGVRVGPFGSAWQHSAPVGLTSWRGLLPSGCALSKNGGPQSHDPGDFQSPMIEAIHTRQESYTRCPHRIRRAVFRSFVSSEIRSDFGLVFF